MALEREGEKGACTGYLDRKLPGSAVRIHGQPPIHVNHGKGGQESRAGETGRKRETRKYDQSNIKRAGETRVSGCVR